MDMYGQNTTNTLKNYTPQPFLHTRRLVKVNTRYMMYFAIFIPHFWKKKL